ncbi:Bis(5'-nucleosyl)-tetraphosphatase [symmetrical] [Serratia symbiotica]|nr:Bis(5'-nucleosyl)-tetraphosphatase [symmetrical] [Serratia symbiotica]
MSNYIIGDIHGCFFELQKLLTKISFNPKVDKLWLTGDLIARGNNSLEVLRFIRSLNLSANIVLGNHDLNLLAIYYGIVKNKLEDKLDLLLTASDIHELIYWLRYQPILRIDSKLKIIISHAGITPKWNIRTAKICASEIEKMLRSNNCCIFLKNLYKKTNNNWKLKLNYLDRLNFSINSLTRMRYCSIDGNLDMSYKGSPNTAPQSLKPWFNFPRLIKKNYTIFFGHWSTLGINNTPKGIIGLDTGCCWGGKLTIFHLEEKKYYTQCFKKY